MLVVFGAFVGGGVALYQDAIVCGNRTELRVAAAPDIAPALAALAERFNAGDAGPRDRCMRVQVTARGSDFMMTRLARPVLGATGADVWVPESSVWRNWVLSQGADARNFRVAASIASTPVVIAMSRPVAQQFGWPRGGVSWATLAQGQINGRTINPGIVEVVRSAASLTGLYAVEWAAGSYLSEDRTSLVRVMRLLSPRVAATDSAVLAQVPRSQLELADADRVQVFPYSEQAVAAYNSGHPAVPLVAVYPSEGSPTLDYPYTLLGSSTRDVAKERAAKEFLAAARSEEGRGLLLERGFRTVTGRGGPGLVKSNGVQAQAPRVIRGPNLTRVAELVRFWMAATNPARLLTLVDVSGSMAARVNPTMTRLDVAKWAGQQALGIYPDDYQVGLWSFASDLAGKRDYRELVPVGPLSVPYGNASRREALATALGGLSAQGDRQTEFGEAVLAAYQRMVATFQPRRTNAIVLLSDGSDRAPGAAEQRTLLTQLRRLRDERRPVIIIAVAYGPAADTRALAQIAAATGGRFYASPTPAQMGTDFMDALIGQSACVRPAC